MTAGDHEDVSGAASLIQVSRAGVGHAHGSVAIQQHHGYRLPDDQAPTHHGDLGTLKLVSVMVQELQTGICRTGWEPLILVGEDAVKRRFGDPVYIFGRIKGVAGGGFV